jgi:6-phosphogluconolactonase/glucosamine-6-phosphate isomerase/deaminase
LDHVEIPATNVYQIRTDLQDLDDAAESYETVLRTHFSPPWPCFKLVLLGLGVEGHTASLFPGSPALEEKNRWVVPTVCSTDPPRRITLTLPSITHAEQIYFFVVGADKANAMRETLTMSGKTPAAMIAAQRPDSVFWVDEAAAAYIDH